MNKPMWVLTSKSSEYLYSRKEELRVKSSGGVVSERDKAEANAIVRELKNRSLNLRSRY